MLPNQMLPDVGIDGAVCIQCALKLANVDLLVSLSGGVSY